MLVGRATTNMQQQLFSICRTCPCANQTTNSNGDPCLVYANRAHHATPCSTINHRKRQWHSTATTTRTSHSQSTPQLNYRFAFLGVTSNQTTPEVPSELQRVSEWCEYAGDWQKAPFTSPMCNPIPMYAHELRPQCHLAFPGPKPHMYAQHGTGW